MLTGTRPFDGETVTDILASVLKSELEWQALPAEVPAGLRRLLRRCLARDPRHRLRAIGDALLELEAEDAEPAATATSSVPPRARARWREGIAWGLSGALLVVLALVTPRLTSRAPGPRLRSVHMEIRIPPEQRLSAFAPVTISPDGRWIAYGAEDRWGVSRLWIRSLEKFEPESLPETEGAVFPFWSPDSRSLGYYLSGTIRRMEIESRISQVVTEGVGGSNTPRGAAWLKDGTILFVPSSNSPIYRVPAAGGKSEAVTRLEADLPDWSHRYPVPLPDGKHFLYTGWSNNSATLRTHGGLFLGSLQGDPGRKLLDDKSSAALADSGWILLRRNDRLVAVPFDLEILRPGPEAMPVDADEMYEANTGVVPVSTSDRGDLLYAVGQASILTTLRWLDREGRPAPPLGEPGTFGNPVMAPDSVRYAVARTEGSNATQVWIGDSARRTLTLLTRGANDSFFPVWSPDGTRVAFVNRDSGGEDLFIQSTVETTARELAYRQSGHDTALTDWSRDGRYLFFHTTPEGDATRPMVGVYDLEEEKFRPILADESTNTDAVLSPDGRWLAYTSDESGTPQIYIRSFPGLERKWLVSTQGGGRAHWSRDGRELWYEEPGAEGKQLMSVAVSAAGGSLHTSVPVRLFTLPGAVIVTTPDAGHTRLLALWRVEAERPGALRIILNWNQTIASSATR
jgi:Tol biopolymer transport system component